MRPSSDRQFTNRITLIWSLLLFFFLFYCFPPFFLQNLSIKKGLSRMRQNIEGKKRKYKRASTGFFSFFSSFLGIEPNFASFTLFQISYSLFFFIQRSVFLVDILCSVSASFLFVVVAGRYCYQQR